MSINLTVFNKLNIDVGPVTIQKSQKNKPALKIDITECLEKINPIPKIAEAISSSVSIINRPLLNPFKLSHADSWFEHCITLLNDDFFKAHALKTLCEIEGIEGINKSYVLLDGLKKIAVIKPLTEEVGLCDYSEGFPYTIKNGIESGTMGYREAIAYKLFPDIVPPTTLAELSSCKFQRKITQICSVQKFVPDSQEFQIITPQTLAKVKKKLYPVISLDLVLANADRHGGNLLISNHDQEEPLVVPIDHGCILSANATASLNVCWLKEIGRFDKLPPEECEKIKKIDFEAGAFEIRQLLKNASYINTFAINLLLTQKLCEQVPIHQLVMYNLQRDDDYFNEFPLTHHMLKLAALDASITLKSNLREDQAIPLDSINKVIDDVYNFIEEQKMFLDTFLEPYMLKDQEKFGLLEMSPQYIGSSLRIHLVYEKVSSILNKLFFNDEIELIKNQHWKDLARKSISEEIIARLKAAGKGIKYLLPITEVS